METTMRALCALVLALLLTTPAHAVPAFPGADGYGKWAKGGRGGKVLFVTNLNDSGPGSFRAACEAEGPRTVIFRVGGTITLQTPIRIAHPYLTIAGQTAPGGGICLKTERWRGDKGALTIRTHDMVLRYLRIRTAPPLKPGPEEDPRGWQVWVDPICLGSAEAHDIIMDHISASWGSKDAIRSWSGPHDVTIQHCILSEGLTSHGHSKGALIGGGSDKFTFYRNLFAHNQGRNPYIKAGDSNAVGTIASYQVVNNVIYDWGYLVAEVGVDDSPYWSPAPGDTRANLIGNYFKPGPSSDARRHEIVVGKRGTVRIYVAGNIGPHRTDDSRDEWDLVGLRWIGRDEDAPPDVPAPKDPFQAAEPFDTPPIPIISALDAYREVLRDVGATKPLRDAVDERVIAQVRQGTGGPIASPSEVGGWAELSPGVPYPDRDSDGIADAWEMRRFGTLDRDGAGDSDEDSYTDLEEFLNGTDPRAKDTAWARPTSVKTMRISLVE